MSDEAGNGGVPRRVVVAEDEALIRLDLVEMLTDGGYLVVGQAGDGRRAVELARELRPDLVILDVKMPELDGISAAERISAEQLAPVVLLTAFSQRSLVERATQAGAMAYLVKPFTAADLFPAIEVAQARYRERMSMVEDVERLEDALATRKAVERAKAALVRRFGMSEPEAFGWIQRNAMDRRLPMRTVAEIVLAEEPDAAPSSDDLQE
jgi:two-component system, response regulator PdtaR